MPPKLLEPIEQIITSDDDTTTSISENIPSEIEEIEYNPECQMWTEKYRPKSLDEYYMPHKQLATVKKWIKDYMTKSDDAKPFLILYGTAGIGKTTLAHLIFKKYKFETIECNASDSRSKKNLQELIGQISKVSVVVTDKASEDCDFFINSIKEFNDNHLSTPLNRKSTLTPKTISTKASASTSNSTNFTPSNSNNNSNSKSNNNSKKNELTFKSFKQTAIIMDEIDGLTGGESGGVQELLDIIVTQDPKTRKCKSICPVICTTNSIREKKLQGLVKLGVVVNIAKPSGSDSRKLIERITSTENFTIQDKKISEIINNANGDYRQIISLAFEEYLNQRHTSSDASDSDDSEHIPTDIPTDIPKKNMLDLSVSHYDNSEDYTTAIKLNSNLGDSPLDKINHFLTHETAIDDIKYICSGDTNLFYLNIYFNVIQVLNAIQNKKTETRTKEQLQTHLLHCCKIYDLLNMADSLNTIIFNDKNWELLNLFEYVGLALPVKEMSSLNIKQKMPSGSYITHVSNFHLQHHTQYNYMRQEQTANDKMLATDCIKTFETDPINIYYKLKTFEIENKGKISKPTSQKAATRKNMSQNPYNIDKNYQKILEKIDSLLK